MATAEASPDDASAGGEYREGGEEGPYNPVVRHPVGVAVAPDGTVYVMDEDGRVYHLNAACEFLGRGPEKTDGDWSMSWAIAVGPDGTVYESGIAIERYSTAGAKLGKWSVPETVASEYGFLTALAVAPGGKVYAADTLDHRILYFSTSGSFLGQWGSEGSGPGEFKKPFGIAVAADGTVYVADTYNDRVQYFSAEGEFLGEWGRPGRARGHFKGPHGIAVAPSGVVYVSDHGDVGTGRIQSFTPTGSFLGKWPAVDIVTGLALGPEGDVYVVDDACGGVHRYSAEGVLLGTWGVVQRASLPFPREQETRLPAGDSGNRYRYAGEWGGEGSREGEFRYPYAIAVSAGGVVYVADTDNFRIQYFTAAGSFLGKWGSRGKGDGNFACPSAVAIARNGTIYVADVVAEDRVQYFTSTGSFLGQWGETGSADGQFFVPRGVAVAPNGDVYVADTFNHRVQRFSASGVFLEKWEAGSTYDGHLGAVFGIAVAPDGRVYATDIYVNSQDNVDVAFYRILYADPGDYQLREWVSYGNEFAEGWAPFRIAVSDRGEVFTLDDLYGVSFRIQRFSANGSLLGRWELNSTGAEKRELFSDLAVGPDGTVYVADCMNHRIQYFRRISNDE